MNTHTFYMDKLSNEDSEIKQVGWDNETKAEARYTFTNQLLVKNSCVSVMDVGCGLGTLRKYLDRNVLRYYVGIDKEKEFILKANVADGGKLLSGSVYDATDLWGKPHAYVSLGAYTLMDDPQNYDECWAEYYAEVKYMIRNAEKCVIVNTFHDVVTRQDPKLFYPKLNDIVRLGQEFGETHYMSLHIFKNYEVFAEFARHK